MKKTRIIAWMLLLALPAGIFAQDEAKSKKSVTLPKAGDIGLGIDLVPLFSYAGHFFSDIDGSDYNSFGGTEALDNAIDIYNPNVSLLVKYMITDHIAARANIGIMAGAGTQRRYIYDDLAQELDPLSEAKIIDKFHYKGAGGSISLGAEYRRGYNRIQGYAGADLIYGFATRQGTMEYANAITSINQAPSRTDWGLGGVVTPDVGSTNVDYWTATYLTGIYNDGYTQYLGVGLHAGVEIFLASHLSIGGEVSIIALGEFGKQCYITQEGYNNVLDRVETRTELITPGDRSFAFGTENLGGKLYMMFYF